MQNLQGDVLPGHGFEMNVDEARSGNFCLLDQIGRRQCRDNGLCDVTRVALQRFGQLHGYVAGVVAMACLLGPFQFDVHLLRLGKLAGGVSEQCGEVVLGRLRMEHYENLWGYGMDRC